MIPGGDRGSSLAEFSRGTKAIPVKMNAFRLPPSREPFVSTDEAPTFMMGVYCDGASIRLRRDLPDPAPRPGELTLNVRAAGICDTDLQLARGYMGYRGVLGHEFVAETDAA